MNIQEELNKWFTLLGLSNDVDTLDSVCMSFRHDFYHLDESEKEKVRFQCVMWAKAICDNQ